MPYLLVHHFDPSFDHLHLGPRQAEGGAVDHYNKGYVQNVRKGQLLAEILEIDDARAAAENPRHVLARPAFPMGPGVRVDPENPRRLLADLDGYVFYLDNAIRIHDILNIRRDVDFHSGNVHFVGHIHVHGSVLSGFTLEAKSIEVDGVIGGAVLRATEWIRCHGGVKGEKKALLEAGQTITAQFAENAQLVAGQAIHLRGSALHCKLASGGEIRVEGRLQGGETWCRGSVHVGDQLGGGSGTVTRVVLGRNPINLLGHETLQQALEELDESLSYFNARSAAGPASRHLFRKDVDGLHSRKELLLRQLDRVMERLDAEPPPPDCQLVVRGPLRPILELEIGSAQLLLEEPAPPSRFRLADGAIVAASL